MTQNDKKELGRKVQKYVFIAAYASVLIFYAVAGGVFLEILLPDVPLWMMILFCAFIGSKLDYKFRGPASRFEQRYVSFMEKEK